MLTAVKILKALHSGSSLPVIAGASDGNTYVIKLRGAGDGVAANVVEWLASKLGYLLDIPVICPVFLVIGEALENQVGDPEVSELIARSRGLNLGTPYLEDASPFDNRAAQDLADDHKNAIFLYDLFLLNIDRNASNPNMIWHRGELKCLDYSSALTIRSVITQENYREHVVLRHLKRHPFYRTPIMPYDFINRLRQVADDGIRQIVGELPDEWIKRLPLASEPRETRKKIGARLSDRKNHGEVLLRWLDMLKILKLETEEERHAKSLQNRQAFERKYGKF